MRTLLSVILCLTILPCASGAEKLDKAEDISLKVLPDTIFGVKPADMMTRYWTQQVDLAAEKWKQKLATLKTPADINAYQKQMRQNFLNALGQFPQPTPLHPQLTGTLNRPGYRIEKLLYQSRPHHYVSAICFVPESDKFKPPYPGVLVPCGHSQNGKAFESYQTMGALLALNGMVALVFDPIEQGERLQVIDKNGKSKYWGVHAHNRIQTPATLIGQSTAAFEIYDGMRGIDYLQSRPDVDPDRIGCTGNSGGGTQTSQLMALDDRIKVAAPSCYITSFHRLVHTIGGQDAEQNIFSQLAFGMDHADYLLMRAPSPVIIAAGIKDFFDIEGTRYSYAQAKKIFEKLGAPDHLAIFENNAGHNYNIDQRQAIVKFFVHFLKPDADFIPEPKIKTFTDAQLQCSPAGQVMLIPGARSVYDIIADQAMRLTEQRANLHKTMTIEQLTEKIRNLTGIKKLEDLPTPKVEITETIKRNGFTIEKLIIYPNDAIALPALYFIPDNISADSLPTLSIQPNGKPTKAPKHYDQDTSVLYVDITSTGETAQNNQGYFKPEWGGNGRDIAYAYLFGKSYTQLRTHDILIAARYLQSRQPNPTSIELRSSGNIAIPALHAAALEKNIFSSVGIPYMISSWNHVATSSDKTNHMASSVYGALKLYNLNDLIRIYKNSNTPVPITTSHHPGIMNVNMQREN